MVRDPIFMLLLILAGALGVAGSTALAWSFLDDQIGIAGIAALFIYLSGFLVLLLATANGPKTALNWIIRCLVPVPMALIVFFALRFFGF